MITGVRINHRWMVQSRAKLHHLKVAAPGARCPDPSVSTWRASCCYLDREGVLQGWLKVASDHITAFRMFSCRVENGREHSASWRCSSAFRFVHDIVTFPPSFDIIFASMWNRRNALCAILCKFRAQQRALWTFVSFEHVVPNQGTFMKIFI